MNEYSFWYCQTQFRMSLCTVSLCILSPEQLYPFHTTVCSVSKLSSTRITAQCSAVDLSVPPRCSSCTTPSHILLGVHTRLSFNYTLQPNRLNSCHGTAHAVPPLSSMFQMSRYAVCEMVCGTSIFLRDLPQYHGTSAYTVPIHELTQWIEIQLTTMGSMYSEDFPLVFRMSLQYSIIMTLLSIGMGLSNTKTSLLSIKIISTRITLNIAEWTSTVPESRCSAC